MNRAFESGFTLQITRPVAEVARGGFAAWSPSRQGRQRGIGVVRNRQGSQIFLQRGVLGDSDLEIGLGANRPEKRFVRDADA